VPRGDWRSCDRNLFVVGGKIDGNGQASCLAGNTAAYLCGGDSHYTDCIVVDYTVGFRNAGGSNRFTRCHVWGDEGVAPTLLSALQDTPDH